MLGLSLRCAVARVLYAGEWNYFERMVPSFYFFSVLTALLGNVRWCLLG